MFLANFDYPVLSMILLQLDDLHYSAYFNQSLGKHENNMLLSCQGYINLTPYCRKLKII